MSGNLNLIVSDNSITDPWRQTDPNIVWHFRNCENEIELEGLDKEMRTFVLIVGIYVSSVSYRVR